MRTRPRVSSLHPAAALLLVAAMACGRSQPAPAPASSATPAATPSATPARPAPTATPPAAPKLATSVAFEELVALVPEVSGWTRGTPRGEQISVGVPTSRAVAQFDSGEMSIDLEIVDSSFNDVVLAPMAMFLQSTYSERSPDGYKQATTIGGYPAFEEWNSTARRADVHALVANRFIVHATGHNVASVDPVRALVQAVNLGRLATLK